MPTLNRLLVDYDLDLLQIIAGQWDVDLHISDRIAAAEKLSHVMTTPEAVSATWSRLGDDLQAALFDLLVNGGRLPFSHFVRRYGEIRPMGPARREREKPWLNPASITESLYYRGLIARGFEATPTGVREQILIPDDLIPLLPRPEPGSVPVTPGYAVAPPRRLEDGFDTAPDDLATMLAYLMLRPTDARTWLTREPVPTIDPYLRRASTPAYRALLVHLAYDLGLIYDEELMGHSVTHVNRDAAAPWLRAPRLHQLRSLAETWAASIGWNDLAYTPGLDADEWPNDPRLARQAVLAALRHVPAGIWWSLEGVIEYIKENNPDFQRPGGDYAAWYLRDTYTEEILHGFQYWDYIEGGVISFILEGPLHWLGAVRAGHGAFVVRRLGAGLLGSGEWPSDADPSARIRVDEQGVITIPVTLSRYDRLQVARFTSWIRVPPPSPYFIDRPNRDEGYYEYRLTPQSIERVTREGITLAGHIIPFLQRLSGDRIPPNVLRMLEAWQSDPGEVVVEDVVIVTARNLSVYERMRKHRQIGPLLGRQVGPRSYAVRRSDLLALLTALRQMGILPLFEGYKKDDRP
ncbi:MAG: hypothetical protein Kow00124_12810 [Anaerolineae bacterium]